MMEIKRILVGVDGSENALRALRMVVSMASRLGASVTLIHGIAPSESALFMGKYARPLEVKAMGEERLHSAILLVRESKVPFDTVVEFGNPAEIILDRAKQSYDLIAVGSRGLTGLEEFLMGSVSSKVVHLAHTPVLVVP